MADKGLTESQFMNRFNGYGTPGSVSSSMSPDTELRLYKGLDMARRDYNRSLIDNAFPSQGNEQPAHLGSQSMSPDKSEP